MSTGIDHAGAKEYNSSVPGTGTHGDISLEEHQVAKAAARYGYGPLVHRDNDTRLRDFGGETQPGLYQDIKHRSFGDPVPLGLSAFALTAFVLSLINMNTRNVAAPNIVVSLAFGYGGLVQLLAGMWAFAVGNTVAGTALSSYGGFWLSFGVLFTPGGFEIVQSITTAQDTDAFYNSFGFFLMGWFIFTTILLIGSLRTNFAFFFLFFCLDLTFLLLALGYLQRTDGAPTTKIIKAGGFFGLLTAFMAWYNATAGLLNESNSFFLVPVIDFPWSATGRERRLAKGEKANV